VNPRYFSIFYDSMLESAGDSVALVREDGVFLAHTPETSARSKGKDTGLMLAMAAGADAGVYSGESSVDGRGRMVAYRRVGSYPIYVSYGLSHAAIWMAWRRNMMSYVLVTLLAMGMLLAAAALVRSRHMKEQLAVRRYAEESALRAAAEQSSRAKDEFLAALSHELRNPLSAIANAAELMKRQPGDSEHNRAALDIVSRQVKHLKRLLGDLLDVARTNYGKLQLEKQTFDAMQLARTVVADMSGQDEAAKPGSEPSITVSGAPVAVCADPARLRQMMENLLDNARKYGGRNISLDIGSNGDDAEITVTDDGKGIDQELLPRLFEPFVQGRQTIERAKGGLGLGLSLVRRLADLHGGSLVVASRPGRTVFTIRLPLAGSAAMASAEAAGTAPARRRLMLVEDQQDSRESLAALLRMEGHEVLAVADGHEALRQFAQFRPYAVLIDIGLPQMDGYELAHRLRALTPEGMRLLALTGYGQASDKEKSRDAGFVAHLVKPVSFEELRKWL
jgi:signal transduction histidine kinase